MHGDLCTSGFDSRGRLCTNRNVNTPGGLHRVLMEDEAVRPAYFIAARTIS
jgi:hypothetical protein